MAIEIVSFPIKNGGSFHIFLYVYQRVIDYNCKYDIHLWQKINDESTHPRLTHSSPDEDTTVWLCLVGDLVIIRSGKWFNIKTT